MSAIPPVDRSGVVSPMMPVAPLPHREPAPMPFPGDGRQRRESPSGKHPQPRADDEPHAGDLPATVPHPPFGHLVDTFAMARCFG